MSKDSPIIHGSDHCPGGPDPIPCLEFAGGDRAVEYQFGGSFHKFVSFVNFGKFGSFAHIEDAGVRTGSYLECTSQNAYFVIGFPLGPRWSSWSIDAAYSRMPDGGILDLSWATSLIVRTEEGFDDDGYDIGKPDFPNHPDVSDDADWYESDSAQEISGYAASPVANNYAQQIGRSIRITGKYGDQLTANGVAGPGLVQTDFNGGDGNMWWLRGKLARAGTEGGFRFRLHWLRVVRTFQDIGYPL